MLKTNHGSAIICIFLLSLLISSCGEEQQLASTPVSTIARTPSLTTRAPTITPPASPTPTQTPKVEYVKGITLGGYYEAGVFKDHLTEQLAKMKKVGANTVSVVVVWFTPNQYSNEIRPMPSTWVEGQAGITIPDADIRRFAREAQKLGLNTDIIVQLMCDKYTCWTGGIQPSNPKIWDQAYIDYALHIAHIAEEERVNRLILTDEMWSTLRREDFMLRLIKEVREVYHGELMISTGVASGRSSDYKGIPISVLRAVDRLGLNAAIPATSNRNATADEMVNNLIPQFNQIADYYERIGYTNLTIASMGTTWLDGSAISPGNPPKNTAIDFDEQALYIRAYLTALPKSKLGKLANGVVIWDWTLDSATIINGEADPNSSYSLGSIGINPLAQQVLFDFWVKGTDK